MKSLQILFSAFVLCLVLTACGGNNDAKPSETATSEEENADSSGDEASDDTTADNSGNTPSDGENSDTEPPVTPPPTEQTDPDPVTPTEPAEPTQPTEPDEDVDDTDTPAIDPEPNIENSAPTLSGVPQASITTGEAYSFFPIAEDADGDALAFTVQNAPLWLIFNATDGSLSGTPTAEDVGISDNIIVSVSDGTDSVSIGPFSIVVIAAEAAPPQTKKYNPGHYIDLLRYQTTSDWSDNYITDAIRAGVTGIQARYYWRDLETAPGVYDFSHIEHDLQLLSSQGMHLIVNPADKTFKEALPVPDYLIEYLLPNRQNGYTVKRWEPYVVDRWVALMEALGEHFDNNSYFEAVATEESALSIDDTLLTENGYTPEKYRDALIDMLQRSAEALPTTRVFWYMNFFPMRQDYIAQVASAVAPYDVAMGGPDVLPDSSSLTRLAYPFYEQFKDSMELFCVAMPDSYHHEHLDTSYPTQYWTMQELFEYGRDELHLNYMLWTSVPDSSAAYDTYDAYPVIESNPAFNL